MARMIAGIRANNKKQVTRLASKEAVTWVRGWRCGVTVEALFIPPDKIRFYIYRDGGSMSPGTRRLIAEFTY
jgi:hypothetical protein